MAFMGSAASFFETLKTQFKDSVQFTRNKLQTLDEIILSHKKSLGSLLGMAGNNRITIAARYPREAARFEEPLPRANSGTIIINRITRVDNSQSF